MKILWFTWKDRKNPKAGGAELVNTELAKRLVKNGHEVIFLVGGYDGCDREEMVNGYKIIRLGGRVSVYWRAFRYYRDNLRGWADLVVDEINTVPFFCKFFVKEKNILFVHQLCRRIWFYQMIFPLNLVGYILEPIYLRLLNDRKVITISKSTKTDLLKRGFKEEKVSIIVEGIETDPIDDVASIKKFENPTVLSFGAVRPMKRTDHIIKAFEIAKKHISGLELMIAGDTSGAFGEKVSKMAKDSKYSQSIRFLGKVTAVDKTTLMQKAHLFLVASVKEGWGLVVTEANSQGTPAVVYNVDGLRDAVKDNETGLICDENTPTGMAEKIVYLFEHQDLYRTVQKNGLAWSREINFEYSYKQFISKLGV